MTDRIVLWGQLGGQACSAKMGQASLTTTLILSRKVSNKNEPSRVS